MAPSFALASHPTQRTRCHDERRDIAFGSPRGEVRSGHYADERAYDVLLGIGPSPHPASIRAAEHIEETAARFDVRIATNEWFVKVANDDSLT